MHFLHIIVFAVVFLGSMLFATQRFVRIYKNIRSGGVWEVQGTLFDRIKAMLLIGLGQRKMFKNWIPAILHLFIYVAFIITQLELLETVIDGFSGSHRVFANLLGPIYTIVISIIEVLSVLALVATVIFLLRRNVLKVERFQKPELNGFPFKDANLILAGEIFLIFHIFLMNSTDLAMQYSYAGLPLTGHFWVSQYIAPLFYSVPESALRILMYWGWWGHLIGVLFFVLYLPYSKHLHIFLAFPNTFFGRFQASAKLENMDSVTKEVRLMLNPDQVFSSAEPSAEPVRFGAKDVSDLSWKNILEAYACTECGRCTAACPANISGKKLSPRKIMMDTRDRMEEIANGGKEGRQLLGDYVSVEELRACTTCQACVEECPVNISPLDIIMQLRRNLILEESNSPDEWNMMFGNMENNGAPWQVSQSDRGKWAESVF